MAWHAAPPAALLAKTVTRNTNRAARTVLCKPLGNPLRDPLRAAARCAILARRAPQILGAGCARRACARGIVGSTASPATRFRFPLGSQWLAREALPIQILLYEEAHASAQRMHTRAVSWLGGLSVGIGMACCIVSVLDKSAENSKIAVRSHLAGADHASLTHTSSGPLLDLLTRNLVRKNSRLSVGEAYTFASGPPLGVGSYGVVTRATHNRTGLERAVKCIDKQDIPEADSSMLSREVEALRVMDHPNICRLIEYFETDRYLWLVMELCKGEELCERLLNLPAGLPEEEVSHLMSQMLKATLHCHRRSVLHRDLKPENFLFKDTVGRQHNELKLVDFGFCMPVPSPSSSFLSSPSKGQLLANLPGPNLSSWNQPAGTLLYRSPESLQGASASRRDDVWSLGVIFHILLTGKFPFSTNDDAVFQDMCSRGLLQRDVQDHLESLSVSHDAADLVAQLLSVDAAKRITIEAALNHPFIATGTTAAGIPTSEAKSFYDRCERFQKSPRLRRIASAAAARLLVDDAGGHNTDTARAAFLALDRHGKGRITRSDLKDFFRASDSFIPSPSWFASLANEWPALAEPQGIGYTGFVATTLDDAMVSGDGHLCRAVFDLLDAGQDGVLCAKDLQRRLGLSAQEAEQVVCEALAQPGKSGESAVGDRALTFPVFLNLMRTPSSLPAPGFAGIPTTPQAAKSNSEKLSRLALHPLSAKASMPDVSM